MAVAPAAHAVADAVGHGELGGARHGGAAEARVAHVRRMVHGLEDQDVGAGVAREGLRSGDDGSGGHGVEVHDEARLPQAEGAHHVGRRDLVDAVRVGGRGVRSGGRSDVAVDVVAGQAGVLDGVEGGVQRDAAEAALGVAHEVGIPHADDGGAVMRHHCAHSIAPQPSLAWPSRQRPARPWSVLGMRGARLPGGRAAAGGTAPGIPVAAAGRSCTARGRASRGCRAGSTGAPGCRSRESLW